MIRQKISLASNIITVAMTGYAWHLMVQKNAKNGLLSAAGLRNLRYFTVLSNLFAAIAAIVYAAALVHVIRTGSRSFPRLIQILKLVSAAAVGLTFFTVVVFLGPVYGYRGMYVGANLWFHLIIPLLVMLEFAFLDDFIRLPISATFYGLIPVLLYGIYYLGNILINGAGEWLNRNDIYGFTQWGVPMSFLVFGTIILGTWLITLLLWRASRIRKEPPLAA